MAMTISVARAFSITDKEDVQRRKRKKTHTEWPMETDLPRTVLQTNDNENSGCGKEVPGYFMIESLLWEDSWPAKARNTTACSWRCNEHQDCVGFSARQPTHGRMQCNLYRGLRRQLNRGTSFVRCMPGFQCQKGLPGFQFSHAGTWRDGKQIEALDDESVEECAAACRRSRACVGITHFVAHDEDKYCFHFENADNKGGPRRDMRAYTYSKCAAQDDAQVPEESMLLLRALASKKDERSPSSI